MIAKARRYIVNIAILVGFLWAVGFVVGAGCESGSRYIDHVRGQ